MIEMKFVSNGTILQNKISFTHKMRKSKYFRHKQNWWISLTSTNHCLHCIKIPHLKWPVFAVQHYAVNGYKKELTITTYSLTTSAQLDWKKISENSILVCYVCVVTLNDYTTDTNDDMTSMTVFHTEHINTNTWVHSLLSVRTYRHIAHCTAWLKSWVVFTRYFIHMRSWCVRFSLDIDLSILFILYFTHLLSHSFHFLTLKLVEYLRPKGYGLHWRDLIPHRLWAQRLRLQGDLRRVLHRASKGFPTTPSTMTPRSRTCCAKLTEYMSITLNEKTCLSVCWRESGATCWAK